MADLSAYVDFTVKIDNSGSTPQISLTDISNYPVGTSAFQGFIKVTQPDGISVGSDAQPDITDAVRTGSKPYRFSSNGQLQNGTYTVQYVVKCTGYDDTVVTRQFTLGYVRPTLNLAPSIDAFTPGIKVMDNTDFFQQGFIVLTLVRFWSGVIYNVGATSQNIMGTSQSLDFAYNNNYYDAMYYASLIDTISYQLAQYSWVSIIDKITNQVQFDVYTPLTVIQFQAAIYALTTNSLNLCGKADTPDVIRANQLLATIIASGQMGDTVGLQESSNELYTLLFPGKVQVHLNKSIPSYIFNSSPSVPLVTLPQGVIATENIGGIVAGQDLSGDNILDAFVKLLTPELPPSASLTVNNPLREVGANGDYILNWSVIKGSNPITSIILNGTPITPTGINQSGTQSGTAASTPGNNPFSLIVSTGTKTDTANAAILFDYMIFYGNAVDSSNIRGLPQSRFVSAGKVFTLNTGTTNILFLLALPPGTTLSKIVDLNTNADITSGFTASSISVNNGGGVPVTYTLLSLSTAVPFDVNHQFQVTIN